MSRITDECLDELNFMWTEDNLRFHVNYPDIYFDPADRRVRIDEMWNFHRTYDTLDDLIALYKAYFGQNLDFF